MTRRMNATSHPADPPLSIEPASKNAERGILTVNAGSSSIRFALYRQADPPSRIFHGKVDRIGLPDAHLAFEDDEHDARDSRAIDSVDHAGAASVVLDCLDARIGRAAVGATGHRVVHGGARYREPTAITEEVLATLREIAAWSPEHLPPQIALIERLRQHLPHIPHVACFDTAFHRDMPRVATLLPLPRRYEAQGVARYGFHGLSYAYVMEALAKQAGAEAARGRLVLAHLGNGASLAAVRDGASVDTSMGFTPAAGIPMSTRAGDIDPGLVLYFAATEGMTAERFHRMVNRESGLLGISETSSDVRDLLAREVDDVRAREALALFCYQVKKSIGAFAAALGGLDGVVFAGGIGENAPVIRERICDGLGFLGISLDLAQNFAGANVISARGSRVVVRVVRTDEEAMIARGVVAVMNNEQPVQRAGDPSRSEQ
jgi:acetate kinase